jgi:hypothetical protein
MKLIVSAIAGASLLNVLAAEAQVRCQTGTCHIACSRSCVAIEIASSGDCLGRCDGDERELDVSASALFSIHVREYPAPAFASAVEVLLSQGTIRAAKASKKTITFASDGTVDACFVESATDERVGEHYWVTRVGFGGCQIAFANDKPSNLVLDTSFDSRIDAVKALCKARSAFPGAHRCFRVVPPDICN